MICVLWGRCGAGVVGNFAQRDATSRPLLSDLEAEIGEDQLLGLRSH